MKSNGRVLNVEEKRHLDTPLKVVPKNVDIFEERGSNTYIGRTRNISGNVTGDTHRTPSIDLISQQLNNQVSQ